METGPSTPEEVRRSTHRGAVGLFGGTFDPPHAGHVHLAEVAQEALGLAEVLFIPAAHSPHRQPGAASPPSQRLALVELLCAPRSSWRVSTLELDRGGPSYTIDTVEALRAAGALGEEPPYLLLGGDQLGGLHAWHRVADLLALVRPVVVHRGRDAQIQLRALRDNLAPDLAQRVLAGFLDHPPVDISSTDLRERLGRGEDPGEEIPAEVMDCIRRGGLYGWSARGSA